MIRVLFVEASSGGVLGGSLTGLHHLIRGLPRDRFAPMMVLYEAKTIEKDLAALGVPIHHINRRRLPKEHALMQYEQYHRARQVTAIRSGLRSVRQAARLFAEEMPAALALARVIARTRADVLHLGNGVRANFDGILAGLVARRPTIVHVKGFEKYGARERWASRQTHTMVCMTEAILDYCGSHGLQPHAARVVYDAVDDAWLQPRQSPAAVRRALGIAEDAPCLILAGNIQQWKGQHVLVEAMADVARVYPDAHCLIAGGTHRSGTAYAETLQRRTAELGLSSQVHFLGFREDVVDVMNAADVVVHASVRPEPFGRVILEGMLLAKPVIATAAGGVPELIEHERTGYLVPPGDVAALASCICRVLAAPGERAVIGESAQRWARSRFSLARQVDEMAEIYAAAVAGRS
jgi:glycosyltransferase involved in cell wall biosynthesis